MTIKKMKELAHTTQEPSTRTIIQELVKYFISGELIADTTDEWQKEAEEKKKNNCSSLPMNDQT